MQTEGETICEIQCYKMRDSGYAVRNGWMRYYSHAQKVNIDDMVASL